MSLNQDFFNQRRAGILLHPTSLPGSLGNGDLGEEAYRFVDFIADSGFTLWQMLPLGTPHEDLSPYQCQSVHAANPLLISLENLIEKELGLNSKKEIEDYGMGKFNAKAKDSVLRYDSAWKEVIPKTGRWVDMDHPYKTMDSTYTESLW